METFNHGYAVLIGVGADLPVTARDAKAIFNVLADTNRAAYPNEQLQLITDTAASRNGILGALKALAEQTIKDDEATVIIYYSGHGCRKVEHDGTYSYFIVPYGYDNSNHKQTSVSGSELAASIESIRCQKLFVILDCCFAAGIPTTKSSHHAIEKFPLPFDTNVLTTGSGRVIVASSQANEYSHVGDIYSIFTECLLEALNGKSTTDADDFVRVLNILAYLFKEVPTRSPGSQHPILKRAEDVGNNFPICRKFGSKVTDETQNQVSITAISGNKKQRLMEEREILVSEWRIRVNKVRNMRISLAIETNPSIKYQLEHLVLREETQIADIGSRIDQIDFTIGN